MTPIETGTIHHMMLTISDLDRTRDFYANVLGMAVVVDDPHNGRLAFSNGSLLLGVHLPPDPSQTPPDDAFSEHRMGLDHLSFNVESRATLEQAAAWLDQHGVARGDIKDLSHGGPPILVLAFRDPDNIQLELAAPVDAP